MQHLCTLDVYKGKWNVYEDKLDVYEGKLDVYEGKLACAMHMSK